MRDERETGRQGDGDARTRRQGDGGAGGEEERARASWLQLSPPPPCSVSPSPRSRVTPSLERGRGLLPRGRVRRLHGALSSAERLLLRERVPALPVPRRGGRGQKRRGEVS